MKNEKLQDLVLKLKEKSSNEKVNIWKALARELEKPTRKRRIVNLFSINKHTKENDIVVIPGKVLSTGDINHKLTVAAYAFSKSAIEKIEKNKGSAICIEELIERSPKGEKIKILG